MLSDSGLRQTLAKYGVRNLHANNDGKGEQMTTYGWYVDELVRRGYTSWQQAHTDDIVEALQSMGFVDVYQRALDATKLSELKHPERFLMVTLNTGVRGFISMNELTERQLEFINDALKRGVDRFSEVGPEEL